ncbi:MAG: DUF5671 domain-containing protein [Acidimicrobiales bacterium]
MLFSLFAQLAAVGTVIWLVVRAVTRHRRDAQTGSVDTAAAARRLVLYALLLATAIVSTIGAGGLAGEAVRDASFAGRSTSTIARSLAFLLVGVPAWLLLLRFGVRRLAGFGTAAGMNAPEAVEERQSAGWFLYINVTLAVSLIVSMVFAQQVLRQLFGNDGLERQDLSTLVIWVAVWALHWFWLQARFPPSDQVQLAVGSAAGLVASSLGLHQVVTDAIERLWPDLRPDLFTGSDSRFSGGLATLAVGAAVWVWHWQLRYRRSEPDVVWQVVTRLLGRLGGLAAAAVGGAVSAYTTLVWFVGDPLDTVASRHFDSLPGTLAALIIGSLIWWYHVDICNDRAATADTERLEPQRIFEYLTAAAGLGAAVAGVTLAVVGLTEALTPVPFAGQDRVVNRMLAAITVLAVGLPIWLLQWVRVGRVTATSGLDASLAERRSISRRVYLVGLFGIGGAVTLVSLLIMLTGIFEDLLDDTFGSQSIRSQRVPLGLIVAIAGSAWYHFTIFRNDRRVMEDMLPPPPPTATLASPRHIVLVSADTNGLAERVAVATGAEVTHWHRSDLAAIPMVDVGALAARIAASDKDRLLVLIDEVGTTLVPFDE